MTDQQPADGPSAALPTPSTTPARPAGDRVSAAATVERLCATIPDYPEAGILFRDLTPVFADGGALRQVVQAVVEPFVGRFDAVAGVEARGFLLAAAAAYATGTGVITVRKAGKLPRAVFTESYALEYGEAALEIHRDDIPAGTRVLILDDVLATGGTLAAAVRLLERSQAVVAGLGVVLELATLSGRKALPGYHVESLLTV